MPAGSLRPAAADDTGLRPLGSGIVALALVAGVDVAATMAMTATTALHLRWPVVLLQLLAAMLAAALLLAQLHNLSWRRIAFALGIVGAALPSFWFAAHHPIEHWDEFMTWLPNAHYLWTFGGFPTAAVPPIASEWPGYPPGSSLILAAVWSVAGRVVEHAGPLINVACLLLLPALVLRAAGRDLPQGLPGAFVVGAVLGLAATFLNVAVDWHWVLSSLPDTATLAVFAVAFVLAAELRFAPGATPRSHLVALAAILALIVNLRQTAIVAVVLLLVATLLVAWSWRESGRGRWLRPLRLLALVSLPWVAVWLCWQFYLTKIFSAPAFGLHAVADWNFAALPDLLRAMLDELVTHWPYFLPVIVVVARGCYVLGRRWLFGERSTPVLADRMAALFALVQGGYLAFLFLCYLAAFSDVEARGAAEFFRYQTHLGGAALVVAMALIVQRLPRSLPVVVAPAVLAAQLATVVVILPEPGLFEADADYGHAEFRQLREIGRLAGEAVARDRKRVSMEFLTDDDYLANLIVRYEMWSRAPRLLGKFTWDGANDGELPGRFAAALRRGMDVVSTQRSNDEIHCAIHGHDGQVALTVPQANAQACQPLLDSVRAAMDSVLMSAVP